MHYETRCGDLVKVIWWDGQGACLFVKRLDGAAFCPMAFVNFFRHVSASARGER